MIADLIAIRGAEIMPGIIWEFLGAARIREYSRNNLYRNM